MKKTLYIYLDVIQGTYHVTDCNFWTTPEEQSTGLSVGQYSTRQLASVQEIEFPEWNNPVGSKIAALESKVEQELAECHIKVMNLKTQIQELKCLTHDEVKDSSTLVSPFDSDLPY